MWRIAEVSLRAGTSLHKFEYARLCKERAGILLSNNPVCLTDWCSGVFGELFFDVGVFQ